MNVNNVVNDGELNNRNKVRILFRRYNMKAYEVLKILRTNTIPMAEVKIKIDENIYSIKDIKWMGLENGGDYIINIK